MALTLHPDGGFTATGSAVHLVRLHMLIDAINFEGATGMRVTRGPSALARAKRELKLPPSTPRRVVLRQLMMRLAELERQVQQEPIIFTQTDSPESGDTQ